MHAQIVGSLCSRCGLIVRPQPHGPNLRSLAATNFLFRWVGLRSKKPVDLGSDQRASFFEKPNSFIVRRLLEHVAVVGSRVEPLFPRPRIVVVNRRCVRSHHIDSLRDERLVPTTSRRRERVASGSDRKLALVML